LGSLSKVLPAVIILDPVDMINLIFRPLSSHI
jgi:hypothetical protein